MSVTVQGVTHHLVSYYNVEDVMAGNLRAPSSTEALQFIRPRPELTSKQSFRSPIEEAEDVHELSGQAGYPYRMGQSNYDYGKQQQMYYSQPPYPPPMPGQQPMQQYSGTIPSMSPGYLQTNIPPSSIGSDRPQYGQYDQGGYNRSMPPTPTNSIPTTLAERTPQAMYPPTTMSRPIGQLSPISMDSRGSMPYGQPYNSIPSITSPTDPHRPGQHSPVAMKYEDRREHTQPVTPSYPPSGPPYYGSSQMAGAWNGQPQR